MDFEHTTLLDCGHVGLLAGVCQYCHPGEPGCGDRLCEQCLDACASCRRVLCPRHQVQAADNTVAYCRDHVNGYVLRTLLGAILGR